LFERLSFTLILLACSFAPVFGEHTPRPKAFSLCTGCHTTAAEGQHRNAPPLTNIVGRKIASVPNFKYSDTLKAEEGIWTKARLHSFLQRPNHALPGTKMYFRGLRNPAARAELINWLATAEVPSVVAPHSDRPPVTLASNTNRALDLFQACVRCHSYTEGDPAKIGPNLFGVVGRPVASFPGFDYSARLSRRGGTWNTSRLHTFFTEKKPFSQGSHMAFRALTLKKDRELLITLLKSFAPDKLVISPPASAAR